MSMIVCNECQSEFGTDDLSFKTVNTKIEDKSFEVVFYKCPECGKPYIVCMLDNYGKKLQNKYIEARNKYIKLQSQNEHSAMSVLRLEQKLKKIDILKADALGYQKTVIEKYADLLPEETFK